MNSSGLPVIFAFILCVALGRLDGFHIDMPENLKTAARLLHNHCVPETGVDEALIAQSVNGYLPEDKKLGCYIHCIFETAGLIHTETGKVRFDEVAHLFPEKHKDMIERVTEKCGTIHGDDPCDTSLKTMRCYFEMDPENTQLI